ncbi:multicopper polyphenol oxidase [Candidatus Aerophobetes bacterium]|uniref:Purine nucleoside phosphorylase n=1 Tax=Aerophobetes bacterium TaxID=2030807 RepID=A0A2A4YEB7_UNCAE|nr:MAG: multicopper polyphenol oxidase [Candidatus Aerophobetes bacterium]
MEKKVKKDLEWLEFELLKEFKEITHGVFLRKGGVSRAPFTSLNVGGAVGDDPKSVLENRKRISSALNLKKLVIGLQKHEDKVLEIDPYVTDSPQSVLPKSSDGIFTKKRKLGLCVFHADCQAALFYDPKKRVIANIHSGWRGNRQNIYERSVYALKEAYGVDPKDLLVCISPSLGPKASEFIHYKSEWPEEFHEYRMEKDNFDLWKMSYDQLRKIGIKNDHIEIAKICTFENEKDFFSYRRNRTSGRNATVIGLN